MVFPQGAPTFSDSFEDDYDNNYDNFKDDEFSVECDEEKIILSVGNNSAYYKVVEEGSQPQKVSGVIRYILNFFNSETFKDNSCYTFRHDGDHYTFFFGETEQHKNSRRIPVSILIEDLKFLSIF